MALASSLAIDPGGKSRVGASFVGLQLYMLEQFRLYINSTAVISPNIRGLLHQKQLPYWENLKNDGWFDRELLA